MPLLPPLPPQLEQRVNWGWQDFFGVCHPCHPKIHFHFGDFFLFARKSDGVRGDCRLSLAGIIINIGRAPEPYTPYFLLPIACHSERVGRSQGRPQGRPQERPQGRPQGRPAALNDRPPRASWTKQGGLRLSVGLIWGYPAVADTSPTHDGYVKYHRSVSKWGMLR